MEHYVTIFDSLFLPQGLALHMSMERHVKNYNLWVICVDDDAHKVLANLQLPNVRLLQISKLETQELLNIKPGRTKAEYCWTLTPFAPRFVFEADLSVERVTYLDADLWFRQHPKPIFDEFNASGKQVLITDHGYAPEYDQSAASGRYCVQFITFTRQGGECVRKWWEERCVEWCYARVENGRFGDQKYLDNWPIIFSEYTHVLQQHAFSLAPWNASRFPYSASIFYHFHSYRYGKYNKYCDHYRLPNVVIDNLYKPYDCDINSAIERIKLTGYTPKYQHNLKFFKQLAKSIKSSIFKRQFHLINFITSINK
jgi:hypothetical protein